MPSIMAIYSVGAIFAQLVVGTFYDKVGMTVGLAGNAAIGILVLFFCLLYIRSVLQFPFIAMLCLALGGCVASLGTPMHRQVFRQ